MLQLESVHKQYSTKVLLEGATAHLRPGARVGLVGPNGAGKTTIFYMIVGLLQPNGGKIFLNGDEVTSLPMYLRAGFVVVNEYEDGTVLVLSAAHCGGLTNAVFTFNFERPGCRTGTAPTTADHHAPGSCSARPPPALRLRS